MLSGTRVLDFTRVLAGPLATMILGDLGADVIKVERPGAGDDTRGWGPPFDDRGESAYYLSVNRNKRGIVADLDRPADREQLLQLIAGADIVVDNFLPGMLERHDIGIDALLARHPRLVWCTITGFGEQSSRPGYDFVVQAEYGWMSITGEPSGAPMRAGVAFADILAGKDAAIAILAALAARAGSGRGRRVMVSLAASATAALVNIAQNVLVSGRDAGRWGNAHPNLVPYQLFEAADRPIVIAVGSDAQFAACVSALALPELARDTRLATNAGRLANRAFVVDSIAARVLERDAAVSLDALNRGGVPCGIVKTVLETLRDVDASPLTGVPPSVPGSVRLPPPMLGEHDQEIRRLGWGAFAPSP
ncbi:MAG: CoA transferase [Gemmatimonadota bacterium]|nr:CoA transferase [Gemmatimonadota bacterium]